MSSTEYHGQNSEFDDRFIEAFREHLDAIPVTLPPFSHVLERAQSGRRRLDRRRFPMTLAAAAAAVLLGALAGAVAMIMHVASGSPQVAQNG
ncbi:MAG: hypothetical protein J2P39_11305, partial [Candidatus Dormibacteraeota bacterium]|nr:hypothetical protein [Candidatus Dormibacteraeota bacterium]